LDRISIITATFNSESTIQQTIDSVLSQQGVDVEHIIVDGGSIDGTMAAVGRYPHIRKKISEPDRGMYDAMNKGIAMAEGDVIGILNSDDVYHDPYVLSSVSKTFRDDEVDVAYGDLEYVSGRNADKVLRYWRAGSYRKGLFKLGWMPPHPSFFVRREAYLRHGRFNLELGTAADYELMLRFMHLHGLKPAYIDRVLVRMRSGGASNESFSARWKANRNDLKAWGVNGIKPYWFTIYLKPMRKIGQFMMRRRD
jgi:glycosyltransferase involved in cell wall biosynthesis